MFTERDEVRRKRGRGWERKKKRNKEKKKEKKKERVGGEVSIYLPPKP